MNPPAHIAEVWPFYRIVLEGYASHGEAERMTIDDIDDLCDAADAWHAAQPQGRGDK